MSMDIPPKKINEYVTIAHKFCRYIKKYLDTHIAPYMNKREIEEYIRTHDSAGTRAYFKPYLEKIALKEKGDSEMIGDYETHEDDEFYEDEYDEFEDLAVSEKAENKLPNSTQKQVETQKEKSAEQPKRGRPKKPEGEKSKRKQVSVYLEPEVYDGVKELCSVKDVEISKMIESAVERFVSLNSANIAHVKEIKKHFTDIELNF